MSHSWKKKEKEKGQVHLYNQGYRMLQTKEEGTNLVNIYYTPVPTTCEVKHYNYLYLQMCEWKFKEVK